MNPETQPGSAKQQARDKAGELTDQMREKTSDVAQQARETARTTASQQKGRVADSVSTLASALHKTGEHLDSENQGQFGQVAHMAAERLEQFSSDLQNKSVDQIFDEVQDFARRDPQLFIGGAVVLGLLASRFLKASSSRYQQRQGYYGQPQRYDYYRGRYGSASRYYDRGTTSRRPIDEQDLADYRREALDSEYSRMAGQTGDYGAPGTGMRGSDTETRRYSGYGSSRQDFGTASPRTGSNREDFGTTREDFGTTDRSFGTTEEDRGNINPRPRTGEESDTDFGSTSRGFGNPPARKPGDYPDSNPRRRTNE